MHDHIAVIHENPAGIAVSLNLLRLKASASKLLLHIIDDRLNLIGVCTACDYEIICNYRENDGTDCLQGN